MKKLSLLAATIAVALSGCNGGSGSTPAAQPSTPATQPSTPAGKPQTNRFIDAAVEGIYYSTSSGLSGTTNSLGEFSAHQDDTVTFYLGGAKGLKIGAASNRDVLTPFEAAGKYARALNLAILLQSLDNKYGSSSDEVLTIPTKLQSLDDPAIAALIKDIDLNDRASVNTFLNHSLINSTPVTEEAALNHMVNAFGAMTRGADSANPFAKRDGQKVRYIDVTQYQTKDNYTYVHADKMLPTDLFNQTRGMVFFDYQLNSDALKVLRGSNDGNLSETLAESYLNCIVAGGSHSGGCTVTPNVHYTLSYGFKYMLLNPETVQTTDKTFSWDAEGKMLPFSATNVQQLNHYTKAKLRKDGDGSNPWVKETKSGSYDPVTGIYTEIVEKEQLVGNDCNDTSNTCSVNRTTERVGFFYPLEEGQSDRYVDFTGNWQQTQICNDGQTATMNFAFDQSGLTTTGQECQSGVATDITKETHSYADLANIDYWWFNQAGRESKATLTELNSLVRFCDMDGYRPGNICGNQFYVKWEYQPAGKNWDEGLLIRVKMNPDGSTDGQPSILQKVK
ncbi:hypothetical protein [Vibrio sonorensis]|uniref:hypothetical protein n=1 Tax=Vibrio sonorensis TaxID=1004316 RepID=UPI0008DA1B82|nr:hypothetical protein [Vibrio sonorensis]